MAKTLARPLVIIVCSGKIFCQISSVCYFRYFRQGTLLHNYGDVLAILLRLRQLCCHPFLVAKAAEAVKETMGKEAFDVYVY